MLQRLKTIARFGSLLLLLLFVTIAIVRGLSANTSTAVVPTLTCPEPCPPLVVPTSIVMPTAFLEPVTGETAFKAIDSILNQAVTSGIAYNAPAEMQVSETVRIELLLNPSLSEAELVKQVSQPGNVHSLDSIEITPQMKAEILSPDEDAFSIRALHDSPVQLISATETTKWIWYVTARKGGIQKLTIVIYRLIKYGDEDSWRLVETYESDINVRVTLAGRIQSLEWRWILLGIVSALLLQGFWRWYDRRNAKFVPARKGGVVPVDRPVRAGAGHIFISYRRSDSADITGRIYDRLVDEFGRIPIFKDVDSIPLGVDFKEYLDQKVSECRVLLAVIGDRWLEASDGSGKSRLNDPDDFVRVELESALERGIPIIPLLVRGAQMPVDESLPRTLEKLVYKNGIPIRPDPDFHHDMQRLIAALREYLV